MGASSVRYSGRVDKEVCNTTPVYWGNESYAYRKNQVTHKELGFGGWQRMGNDEASQRKPAVDGKCNKGRGSDVKNETFRVIFWKRPNDTYTLCLIFLCYFSFAFLISIPDLLSVF